MQGRARPCGPAFPLSASLRALALELFLPLLIYLLWRPCSIIRAKRKARFNKPPPGDKGLNCRI